jgi:hypothetical protein
VAREYFYGWDRIVSHSDQISIKSFIGAKIKPVAMTEETFGPRFPIEMAKTGVFSD